MKKKNKIGKIIIAVIVIAALGTALFFSRKLLAKSQLEGITYTVMKETYENVIEVSGTVAAAQEQKLQALSTGTVMSVNVEQGDIVKKGDVIIQLDDTEQVYNLAKHDYDMATARITGASRQITLMKTQRRSLLQKISDRKVSATFDGIIADIDVNVGDSLEAKDAVGTIVDISYLTAEVEVPEKDVSNLQIGQKVAMTFPAYSGTVEGYVTGWPAIGSITSRGATVVNVKIKIEDYPEQILPYYSFSGKIEISPPENFLVVSRNAIGRDDGGAFVVFSKTSEKVYVNVIPYGREYVRLDDGKVPEGTILKAQSNISVSGLNRQRGAPPPPQQQGARR